ncbi:MAG: hypothetical protein R3A50_00755 [Saprospiraceae bacterium]|nr:hypothetical protein [Lewinellaceae bacterium]
MDSKIRSALQPPSKLLLGANNQKKLQSEIILGSPSSGCQGVGICRVMPYGDQRAITCPKVTAWIKIQAVGNISISFLKADMSPRYIKRHFGWMLFQVYEPYEMPGGISQALGYSEIVLRPGIYPVWESPHYLTVDF